MVVHKQTCVCISLTTNGSTTNCVLALKIFLQVMIEFTHCLASNHSQYVTGKPGIWIAMFQLNFLFIAKRIVKLLTRQRSSSLIRSWGLGVRSTFEAHTLTYTNTKLMKPFKNQKQACGFITQVYNKSNICEFRFENSLFSGQVTSMSVNTLAACF